MHIKCTSFNLLPGDPHLQSICPPWQHTESQLAGEGLQDQLPPPTAPQAGDTLLQQHSENPAKKYSIKLKLCATPVQNSQPSYTVKEMLQAVCGRGKPQRFPASGLQTQAMLLVHQLLLHRLHLLS